MNNTTTRMIIARHGNTFGPDDTPTRVGAKTDLPLVEKGRIQAEQLGEWLSRQSQTPAHVIAGPLKRTREMADIACQRAGIQTSIQIDERLREIDYGPDENQTEDTVIARIGENAIKLWDQSAIVPEGWNVNPDQMISDWADIAGETLKNHKGKTILIVTSNGVARFAPHLTGQFDAFRQQHNLKLATGALGTLVHDGKGWSVENWNLRPKDHI